MIETRFLPISKQDMEERGWDQLDFLIITGDAYIDHPSFGIAIIGRLLEAKGYRVGVIAQPDWRTPDTFKALGRPRLGVLVSAGNLDSMLNHYTAAKHPRREDVYSPGGKTGRRPDRATIVYCNRVREVFGDIPLIIGGIEASLRRFAHYDYWEDRVRRSLLLDSRADILVYGMGERQVEEIAKSLAQGIPVADITHVPGTVVRAKHTDRYPGHIMLPAFEAVNIDKRAFAEAFKIQYREQDPIRGKTLIQPHGDVFVAQNPPARPLTTAELDYIYGLPYVRDYHPVYNREGGVPAIQEVKFSITSHRGCFGACAFCALVSHQGRIIQTRSRESILAEAELLTTLPDFKGIIHDVGGPTANFRIPACPQQEIRGTCKDRQCLFPEPCRHLRTDHTDYIAMLRELRQIPGVKKVFIRSGLRYDYLLAGGGEKVLRELCEHHVSGQLKVAPEHVSRKVTDLMGKPGREVYERFVSAYRRINRELGRKQYLVPYFISGHPGCSMKEAVELAEFIRDMGYNPEQVQDFIPTPGTLSTCMYYTGINPMTGEKVYVPSPEEKRLQRALMQYRNPKNYRLVYEALIKAGRRDLIGYGPKCLIRPPAAEPCRREMRNGRTARKKRW